jgi:hypothetical protein
MPKHILPILGLAFAAIGFTGCSNNLNINAPYKDITVVYGLLDQNDTTHYIRINKAFLGQGNALTMAQQYDSINYPAGTLTVALQDYDAFGDPPTTIPLSTTMNIPVVPGVFSYPNQIEYYTKAILNPNDTFRLVITNNKTGKVVKGATGLLPDITLTNIGTTYFAVNWFAGSSITINWNSVPNGDIYQLTFRFFYTETVAAVNTVKYVDWVFAPVVTAGNGGMEFLSTSYSGSGFLQALHTLIPAAGVGVTRTGDSVHIMFSTGSQDFTIYSTLSQPSLTVNQDKPFYTDLINGIGIFSARHTQVVNRLISNSTEDTISTDVLTADLGFH